MTDTSTEQRTVVFTPHPLQRVGACAFCALAGVDDLARLTPDLFDAVVDRLTSDAVRAALVTSTKAEDGFWLKTSGSYFPNSKMNHPQRFKEPGLPDRVAQWRRLPPAEAWPPVSCALCGRQAVGFYGKTDVPLAASIAYRNTVPPGHGGLALCWPCVCCFYALPYGCVLTGGPSSVLHSFDNDFLRDEVRRQVAVNDRHLTLGVHVVKSELTREATALLRLREHVRPVGSDVDLIVFSNDNREPSLTAHTLDQPLAEWLRRSQRPSQRQAFTALVRAHLSRNSSGLNALARNAFRNPAAIVATVARHMSSSADRAGTPDPMAHSLAKICLDFTRKVLNVNNEDIVHVEALAGNLAAMIAQDKVRGPLTGLLRAVKNGGRLAELLRTMGAKWLLSPPPGASGPLMTTQQFRLLFDPDGQSWLYRQLLTVAVLQRLSELGWRPDDAPQAAEEYDAQVRGFAEIDERHINADEDGETQ